MTNFINLISPACYLFADDFFDICKSRLLNTMLFDERFDLRINVVAVIDVQ